MTKKHLYKDLYICKWIKVYRPIQANGDCCCCLEFALPFFYYVKFTLAKPMRIPVSKILLKISFPALLMTLDSIKILL